jgi:hypothetical protein
MGVLAPSLSAIMTTDGLEESDVVEIKRGAFTSF